MKKILFICLCMGAVFFIYSHEIPAKNLAGGQTEVYVPEYSYQLKETK